MKKDLAGNQYWDNLWKKQGSGFIYNDVFSSGFIYRIRKHHIITLLKIIERSCITHLAAGKQLLEIGCGASEWLPAFANRYGVSVTGIDYSEEGCQIAMSFLDQAGVLGNIIQADLFSPPTDILEAFDLVISIGVLEHFSDTESCLQAMSRFLKPGGMIVTIIPNMLGFTGWLQKLADYDVFLKHIPLSREDMIKAHTDCGLTIEYCDYVIPLRIGVVNFGKLKKRPILRPLWYFIYSLNSFIQLGNWALLEVFKLNLSNRHTSPYICCIAKKNTMHRKQT